MISMPSEEVSVIVVITHISLNTYFIYTCTNYVILCCVFTSGCSELFLNSVPEQLYGKCLTTHSLKYVLVNY